MSGNIRSFIAIELPEHVKDTLRSVEDCLASFRLPVRWVVPANIHVTLKFLGDVPESSIESIGTAITNAARLCRPFSLRPQGVGTFPGLKRPRVVWVGMQGETSVLAALQDRLEKELVTVGFPSEKRPFKAHLTLGRTQKRADPSTLLDALKACGEFESTPFEVRGVTLLRSDLHRTGAVYTKLAEYPLGG